MPRIDAALASLLRASRRGPLPAAAPRPPIPASLGVADYPGVVPSGEPEPDIWLLEHGIISLAPPLTYPAQLLLPQSVQDYYAGGGTEVVYSDPVRTERFAGQVTTAEEWTLNGNALPSFSLSPEAEAGESLIYTDPDSLARFAPAWIRQGAWTGRGRQYFQSKMGGDLASFLAPWPDNVDPDPHNHLLFVDEATWTPWLCLLNDNGVRMRRLGLVGAAKYAQEALVAFGAAMSSSERDFYITLLWAGTVSLESSDPAFFDAFVDESPAYVGLGAAFRGRWKQSYLANEAYACLGANVDEGLRMSLVRLVIAFDDGDPIATVTITEQGIYRGAGVWEPLATDETLIVRNPVSGSGDVSGAVAVIDAFHDGADWKLVRHMIGASVPDSSVSNPTYRPTFCGGSGEWQNTLTTEYTGRVVGGFYLDGESAPTSAFASRVVEWNDFALVETGVESTVYAYRTYSGQPSIDLDACQEIYSSDLGLGFKRKKGLLTMEQTGNADASGTVASVVVLPGTDYETALILNVEEMDRSQSYKRKDGGVTVGFEIEPDNAECDKRTASGYFVVGWGGYSLPPLRPGDAPISSLGAVWYGAQNSTGCWYNGGAQHALYAWNYWPGSASGQGWDVESTASEHVKEWSGRWIGVDGAVADGQQFGHLVEPGTVLEAAAPLAMVGAYRTFGVAEEAPGVLHMYGIPTAPKWPAFAYGVC